MTRPSPTPQAIIALQPLPSSSNKVGLQIVVQVAGAAEPKPLLFDSGSAGLWIYDNVIGKKYVSTKIPASNYYSSGIVYGGTVVTTNVVFTNGYGAAVAKNVPVVRVTSATCNPKVKGGSCPAQVTLQNCPRVFKNKPTPPGQAGIDCLEEGRKLFGTFGADVQPQVEPMAGAAKTATIYTVLLAESARFIIDQSQIQLAPDPDALKGFTMFPMTALTPPVPGTLPNGAQQFSSHFKLCYRIGKSVTDYCAPTIFDTGAAGAIDFKGGAVFGRVPTTTVSCSGASHEFARAHLPVAVWAPVNGKRAQVGAFDSGYTLNWNALYFDSSTGLEKVPTVNAGLAFYNRDEVYFDAVAGKVGVKPLSKPGDIGTETCKT